MVRDRILEAKARGATIVMNSHQLPEVEKVCDRVVFIGNTFTERDIQHNYLETLLTIAYADRNVTFRNMGWSGDTVFVPARAGSGPNKGIDLLVDYVKELRPTVLFVSYGMNESFEGEAPDPNRETVVPLQRGSQYLINVGAVGQPRDGDPRAAWLLLDLDEKFAAFRRVPYSIERTQAEMRERGLPRLLAARLERGD